MRKILGILLAVSGMEFAMPERAESQVSNAQISGRVTDIEARWEVFNPFNVTLRFRTIRRR